MPAFNVKQSELYFTIKKDERSPSALQLYIRAECSKLVLIYCIEMATYIEYYISIE